MNEQLKNMRVLEREHARHLKEVEKTRSKDRREAYLTEDMLINRYALTKGGRQKFVLDYGADSKIEFGLAELNKFAKKIEAKQGKFESGVKGVPVQDLVRISLPIDKQRAKDITAATLFKFDGNVLSFRVTASGETPGAPSNYLVRVCLEEWHDRVKDSAMGNTYLIAAQRASRGHISFDCGCARHQFWYRYLATIGGFSLTPEEHVFPKIRNKGLRGCCCKHTLKTLMILQSPTVQGRIAQEMQTEAKKKGFGTQKTKAIQPGQLQELEKDGSTGFMAALKQFKAKLKEPGVQEAINNHKAQAQEQAQAQRFTGKNRDLLIANLDRAMLKAAFVTKTSKEAAISNFAQENKMTISEVQEIGAKSNAFNYF